MEMEMEMETEMETEMERDMVIEIEMIDIEIDIGCGDGDGNGDEDTKKQIEIIEIRIEVEIDIDMEIEMKMGIEVKVEIVTERGWEVVTGKGQTLEDLFDAREEMTGKEGTGHEKRERVWQLCVGVSGMIEEGCKNDRHMFEERIQNICRWRERFR
eukprot:767026-Hanusia_phi.AAC.6